MTRIVTADKAAWYTRAPIIVGAPLLVATLLVGGWLLVRGAVFPGSAFSIFSRGRQETVEYTTEHRERSTEGSVDSPLRVTLRVPWSTGSADTALAAVAIEVLDSQGNPAKFGSQPGEADGMKPALEIGVWVYDGSVPSEPGTYHVRVVLQKLNGPSQTVELNQPTLTAKAASGPPLTSGYVFARNANLWLLYTDTKREKRLTFVPSYYEYADNATWSPDGKRIAYTYSPKTATDELPTTDIWTVGDDGKNAYPAARHSANESLLEPSWSADGKSLYFTVQTTPPQDATPDPMGNALESERIDRMDLATGVRTQWMPNASMADADANGVVYVEKLLSQDPQIGPVTKFRLRWANADDSQNKVLIDENGYQSLYAPAISPDGKWIAFAAINVPPALPLTPTPTKPLGFDFWNWPIFAAQSAQAHGLPWDLYIISSSGGAPIQLTRMNEDQPHAAWLNNTTIAFMGTTGLYKMSIGADGKPIGQPAKIHDGAVHGGLTWHAP